MKTIFFLTLFFYSFSLSAQKYICASSDIKDKHGQIVQYHEKILLQIDTVKRSITIPQYGIVYLYDQRHLYELLGFKMYVNKDYGEMIVANDLNYARFNFYNGSDMTYEFIVLRK